MIISNESWKVLVIGLIVMAITGACGGMCMVGHKSVAMGLVNIVFGLFICYTTYKYYEKKSKVTKK